MANHKSAVKAHSLSLIRKQKNTSVLTRIKTFSKKVDADVSAKDEGAATTSLRAAEAQIRKAVSKGVLKLNTASRKISALTHKVKALAAK